MSSTVLNRSKLEEFLKSNEKIIGEGFYSRVYSYTLGNVEVAVKRILRSENKYLIWNEAYIYEKLGNHNGLLKFYGVCEINGTPALVLEYLENSKSLKNIIKECEKEKKFIETEKALKIIIDVSECLRYVHSKGFYHGDLKTSNVLVLNYDKSPEDLIIKLIDFNLSSNEPEIKKSPSRDYDFEEEEEFSKTTDLFKLGDFIYETITNKKPNQRIVEDFYKINPSAPKEIEKILKICWDCYKKEYEEEKSAKILDEIIDLENKIMQDLKKPSNSKEIIIPNTKDYVLEQKNKNSRFSNTNIEEFLADVFLEGYNVYSENDEKYINDYLNKVNSLIPFLSALYEGLKTKSLEKLKNKTRNIFETDTILLQPKEEQLIKLNFNSEKAKSFKLVGVVEFSKIKDFLDLTKVYFDKDVKEFYSRLNFIRENVKNYYSNLKDCYVGFISTKDVLRRVVENLDDKQLKENFRIGYKENSFYNQKLFLEVINQILSSEQNENCFLSCKKNLIILEQADLIVKTAKERTNSNSNLEEDYELFKPTAENFEKNLKELIENKVIEENEEKRTEENVFSFVDDWFLVLE